MTIEAINANMKWLHDRLYEARRVLEADGVDEPVFVLLTKSLEERRKVEEVFLGYFRSMYGSNDFYNHIRSGSETRTMTRLELPEAGAHIVLIDI